MTHALDATLARLETLLDGSIAAMKERLPLDDRALADAKGRALLELSRINQRGLIPADDLAETVVRVRAKLRTEGELLHYRLAAAETIADLVAAASQVDEWDGTYGGPAGRGGFA